MPRTEHGPDWIVSRLRRHLGELGRLAAPVVASRAGILMLATLDLAILGRAGAAETAHYALGNSPFIVLMVTGIGLMVGTMVRTSHAFGAEDYRECGSIWRRALLWALIVGGVLTALAMYTEEFLVLTGQDPEMAAGAGAVTAWLGLGLIPTMLYIASAFFLEGLRRPFPVLAAIAGANVVNVALNSVLVFGWGPFPALGADGAAIATTIARTSMAAGLMLYVWHMPGRDRYGVRAPPVGGYWAGGREQRRYGYAAGLSFGVESLSFGVLGLFAGLLGVEAMAVFGIAMNLNAMLFMTALGLASATAVRVGIAHGRRDWPDRALAGWVGLGVTLVLMVVYTVVLTLEPAWIATLYTNDPALLAVALPVIVLIGWIILADGAQIVLSNAIRAAADPWTPTVLNMISFFAVMIPVGYLMAFVFDRGVGGLFEAILIGVIVSWIILNIRWAMIAGRPPRDAAAE